MGQNKQLAYKHYQKGCELSIRGHVSERHQILNEFLKAKQLCPNDGKIILGIAIYHHSQHHYQYAEIQYQNARNLGLNDNDLAICYFNLSKIKQKFKQYDQCLYWLQAAISLGIEKRTFFYHKGKILHHLNKYQQSIKQFIKAYNVDSVSNDPQQIFYIFQFLVKRKQIMNQVTRKLNRMFNQHFQSIGGYFQMSQLIFVHSSVYDHNGDVILPQYSGLFN